MKNIKTSLVYIIPIAIIVAGLAFYGGMKYGQSSGISGNFANLRNLSPEERQQRLAQMGGGGTGGMMNDLGGLNGGAGRPMRGNFTSGEIIQKDDTSVTLKLADGGSKIVFYSSTVPMTKSVQANVEDLKTGENVIVTGSTNADGSLTAQSIQFRPPVVTVSPAQSSTPLSTTNGSAAQK